MKPIMNQTKMAKLKRGPTESLVNDRGTQQTTTTTPLEDTGVKSPQERRHREMQKSRAEM